MRRGAPGVAAVVVDGDYDSGDNIVRLGLLSPETPSRLAFGRN